MSNNRHFPAKWLEGVEISSLGIFGTRRGKGLASATISLPAGGALAITQFDNVRWPIPARA
jgi:hypothetical protein